MSLRKLMAAALALGAVMAAPAEATVFTATWTGKVSLGFYNGTLSDPGTDLTGQSFIAVYTIDDSVGLRITDASTDHLYGGSAYGAWSPVSPVSGRLTVGSYGFSIEGKSVGSVQGINGDPSSVRNPYDYIEQYAHDYSYSEDGIKQKSDYTLLRNSLYDETFTLLSSPNALQSVDVALDKANVFGELYDLHYTINNLTGAYDSYAFTNIFLAPDHLTIAPVATAAVPEPATWAMMLVGFGAIGAAMRRRAGRPAIIHAQRLEI